MRWPWQCKHPVHRLKHLMGAPYEQEPGGPKLVHAIGWWCQRCDTLLRWHRMGGWRMSPSTFLTLDSWELTTLTRKDIDVLLEDWRERWLDDPQLEVALIAVIRVLNERSGWR